MHALTQFLSTPLKLPKYPSQTQTCERAKKLKGLTQAAACVFGTERQDGFIRAKQSVRICPWKTISQHNIASWRNMKKSRYFVWTKYFDWKQTLLGSNISSGHNLNLQYCALTKYFPWTKVEWLVTVNASKTLKASIFLWREQILKSSSC